MLTNNQIIYTTPPKTSINPSLNPADPTRTFTLQTTTLDNDKPLRDNTLLVKTHYLSLDPAMRQWLTAKRSYIAPVSLGAVMRGQSIAQVLRVSPQLAHRFSPGDWVLAYTGWQEYAILTEKEVQRVSVPEGCRPTDALSVLGMTGLTAYFGMTEIGRPREGETVVVSGAAGATGMVAGQVAKILGAKTVVGIAGSEEKCRVLVEEMGFDAAVNYRDPEWRRRLKEATPAYIDVFFDNTGGDILDACLGRAARDARFVICGAISQYNEARPQGPASFMTVISQRVMMKGFIVFDYADKYGVALERLGAWLAQGRIRRREHIVRGGLEAAPQGLVDLYKGVNTGKMMVEVAPMADGKAKL